MSASDRIKVGVLPWGQNVDWPTLLAVGQRADQLGFDSLWTWDHLYPIQGDWQRPIFEGYLILAGWAGVTSNATLGLMVGANTFRNPALTAKLVTTLDHMSNGRAYLGIGGAWFEREHKAYGIEFGSGFGERLDWLDEAVDLMAQMLRDGQGTARGRFYHATDVRNDPRPIQERLPILIGGDGEKKTLRLVAQYADVWNSMATDVDELKHKIEVLNRHCDTVGRDPGEIRKTAGGPLAVDPFEDTDGYLKNVERYAELGIEMINLGPVPGTPDPVGYIRRLGDQLVPKIAEID